MTKFRLPKPAAANVVSRHLYLGSVYTKEQMRAFAEKAVLAEREACAKVCDEYSATGKIEEFDRGWLACAKNTAAAIRARGETK